MIAMMRRRSLFAALSFFSAWAFVSAADGRMSDPDANFGTNGKAGFELTGSSNLPLAYQDSLSTGAQIGGKIFAAGILNEYAGTSNPPVFFARIAANGALEFGAVLGSAGNSGMPTEYSNIVMAADGRSYLAGARQNGGHTQGFVKQFAFNGNAVAETAVFARPAADADLSYCSSLAIDAQGMIVAGCSIKRDVNSSDHAEERAALIRLNPDLTPDASFGAGGVAEFPKQPSGGCAGGIRVGGVVQIADGGYAAGVSCYAGDIATSPATLHVIKMSAAGAAVTTDFGNKGFFRIAVPDAVNLVFGDMIVDGAGRLLVGGQDLHADRQGSRLFIARIIPGAGKLDAGFGSAGLVVHDSIFHSSTELRQILMQPLPEAERPIVLTTDDLFSLTKNGDFGEGMFFSTSTPGFILNRLNRMVAVDNGTRLLILAGIDGRCDNTVNGCSPQPTEAHAAKIVFEPDTTPFPFQIAAQTNVASDEIIRSASFSVQGLDVPTPISISGAPGSSYSLDCSHFTSEPGFIPADGSSICVRHLSAPTASTVRESILTVGTASAVFSTTTASADSKPHPFELAEQTGVGLDVLRSSNVITVSGITVPSPISVSGDSGNPLYDVGCDGGAVATAGMISNGQTVCVKLRSAPTPATRRTATLTIGGVSSAFKVTTADAAVAAVLPAALDFGYQLQGVPSPSRQISLSNSGNLPMTGITVSVSGEYVQTNGCTTLAVGAGCTIAVRFSPAAASTGARSGVLTIASNAGNGSVAVPLAGFATPPVPIITFSPASIDFGALDAGVQSPAIPVTLTNTGSASLTIASIGSSETSFPYTSNCPVGTPIPINGSCTVTVRFSATAAGLRSGAINIISNTITGSDSLALSGSLRASKASLGSNSIDLGPTQIGLPPQFAFPGQISLRNAGSAPLAIFQVVFSGPQASEFSVVQPACPAVLAVNASCNIFFRLDPAAVGKRSAVLTVKSNGPDVSANVSGTGARPVLILTPESLDLGKVLPGQSATSTLRISVQDMLPTISSVSVEGSDEFSLSSDCTFPQMIGNALPCNVIVKFQPTSLGVRNASLKILSDSTRPSITVPITAKAIPPGLQMSKDYVLFPATAVGTSAQDRITVKNAGSRALTIGAIRITGEQAAQYSRGSDCPTRLEPGAQCTLNLTFTPAFSGQHAAQLELESDAEDSPNVAPLLGLGSLLSYSANAFDLYSVGVGGFVERTIRITNPRQAPVQFSAIQLQPNSPFSLTGSDCPESLAAGASCQATLRFTPQDVVFGFYYIGIVSSLGADNLFLQGHGMAAQTVAGTNVATVNGSISGLSRSVQPPAGASLPAGYTPTSLGFFSFTITLPPGATQTEVTFTLPAGVRADSYVKCPAAGGACVVLPATVSGNQLTVRLRDNVAGEDDDPTVGVISDPGAASLAPAPAGGGGSLGWSSLLIGLGALFRRRRSGAG